MAVLEARGALVVFGGLMFFILGLRTARQWERVVVLRLGQLTDIGGRAPAFHRWAADAPGFTPGRKAPRGRADIRRSRGASRR